MAYRVYREACVRVFVCSEQKKWKISSDNKQELHQYHHQGLIVYIEIRMPN